MFSPVFQFAPAGLVDLVRPRGARVRDAADATDGCELDEVDERPLIRHEHIGADVGELNAAEHGDGRELAGVGVDTVLALERALQRDGGLGYPWRPYSGRWGPGQAAEIPLADTSRRVDHADAARSAKSGASSALGRFDKVLADGVHDELACLANMSARVLDLARPAPARISSIDAAVLTWS